MQGNIKHMKEKINQHKNIEGRKGKVVPVLT
jgi:hypothetical protein